MHAEQPTLPSYLMKRPSIWWTRARSGVEKDDLQLSASGAMRRFTINEDREQ